MCILKVTSRLEDSDTVAFACQEPTTELCFHASNWLPAQKNGTLIGTNVAYSAIRNVSCRNRFAEQWYRRAHLGVQRTFAGFAVIGSPKIIENFQVALVSQDEGNLLCHTDRYHGKCVKHSANDLRDAINDIMNL